VIVVVAITTLDKVSARTSYENALRATGKMPALPALS